MEFIIFTDDKGPSVREEKESAYRRVSSTAWWEGSVGGAVLSEHTAVRKERCTVQPQLPAASVLPLCPACFSRERKR